MRIFRAFEGAAGTGKTTRLFEAVEEHLAATTYEPYQRVLALTFMHGSRRRLAERIGATPGIRSRAVATTVDSFATRVVNRWVARTRSLHLQAGDFDSVADACGRLLEDQDVAGWVASAFPVVLVDEAQELSPQRLRIVSALEEHVSLLVAGDEFQCLDARVDTRPYLAWLSNHEVCSLTEVKRTDQPGLLQAGVDLRELKSPTAGPGFTFGYSYPNSVPFDVARELFQTQGSRAIIFAPNARAWAAEIAGRLKGGLQSRRQRFPPVEVYVQPPTSAEVAALLEVLHLTSEGVGVAELEVSIRRIQEPPKWLRLVTEALQNEKRRCGKTWWSRDELQGLAERKAAQYRAFGRPRYQGVPVLSIHQAKNQEFDNVLLLWPPGVPGTDEVKARLMYNAITRAKRRCRVFVRTRSLLQEAPFKFIP